MKNNSKKKVDYKGIFSLWVLSIIAILIAGLIMDWESTLKWAAVTIATIAMLLFAWSASKEADKHNAKVAGTIQAEEDAKLIAEREYKIKVKEEAIIAVDKEMRDKQ